MCQSWVTVDDRCSPCGDDSEVTDEALEPWLLPASNIVYNLSGRQFPGLCERTEWPCARIRGDRRDKDSGVPRGWHRSWGWCGCGQDVCACSGNRSIRLPAYPVTEVLEVVVDGEAVPPDEYRLDDWRDLVRLRDADGVSRGWPLRQDPYAEDGDPGTWSVRFEWGREPPPEGVRAAAVMACELALSCDPALSSKCRLPKEVSTVTGEGTTIVMSPSDFLDEHGKTGLWEVDNFIRSSNPQRADRNATVWTPGLRRGGSRRGTPGGS